MCINTVMGSAFSQPVQGFHHRSPSRRTFEIIQAVRHRHFRKQFGEHLPAEVIARAMIEDGKHLEFLALLPRCRYPEENREKIAKAIATLLQ